MIAYELLMRQTPRESTINKMVTDKNVLFHWDLIMHDFDNPVSNMLLHYTVVYCERILYHQQIVWGVQKCYYEREKGICKELNLITINFI